MPAYPFVTVDVFTNQRFGGNPLAVFTDARGLSDADMQNLAAEFNLSETTFVLPPEDPSHTARMRIFTPKAEMPFICKSIGRTPITQPPGIETLALPNLASKGPRTQKEPRIVDTNL